MPDPVRWLVVICREGVSEVAPFAVEEDAKAYFDKASPAWSDAYLCSIVRGPWDMCGELPTPAAVYHYTEDGDYPSDDRFVLVSTVNFDETASAWLERKDEKPLRWNIEADREYRLDLAYVYAWQELPARAPRRGEG